MPYTAHHARFSRSCRHPFALPVARDFKPGDNHLVGLDQFLAFFGRVSRTINNGDFDAMIREMSA
jgi:hypothetical protein